MSSVDWIRAPDVSRSLRGQDPPCPQFERIAISFSVDAIFVIGSNCDEFLLHQAQQLPAGHSQHSGVLAACFAACLPAQFALLHQTFGECHRHLRYLRSDIEGVGRAEYVVFERLYLSVTTRIVYEDQQVCQQVLPAAAGLRARPYAPVQHAAQQRRELGCFRIATLEKANDPADQTIRPFDQKLTDAR